MHSASLIVRTLKIHSLLLFVIFLFGTVTAGFAQDQYWIYGISNSNKLVRVNPDTFEQTVVGPITVPNGANFVFTGIAYDSTLGRLLVAERFGKIYEINQTTAVSVGSGILADRTADVQGAGYMIHSMTYQPNGPGLNGSRIYVALEDPALQNDPVLLRLPVTADGIIQSGPRFSMGAILFKGVGWRSSPASFFAGLFDPELQFTGLQLFNAVTTAPIGNALPQHPLFDSVSGFEFHPLTNQLFGDNPEGQIYQVLDINNQEQPPFVTQANSSGIAKDLTFARVTPTPTPTPTVTNTPTVTPTQAATPTFTPTPEPTTPACPSGIITACGCDKIEIRLSGGQIQCGPADTLTTSTVPPAPQIVVGKKSVTLVFKKFTAVSDGKTFKIISSTSPAMLRIEGNTVFAEVIDREPATNKALSLRYEIQITQIGKLRVAQRANILSKRNRITVSKLKTGSYSARYRVNILKGTKQVGSSKFSKTTKFKIR